jgi:hypothetical protein
VRRVWALLALAAIAGCGSRAAGPAATPVLVPIGTGPAYRLPSVWAAVRARAPIAGMRCESAAGSRFGVHLELFARRRTLLVPAGIGVAEPHRRRGRYLTGPCSYPLRTREPTGVIEAAGPVRTLGRFFAVWGQPLSPRRLAEFRGGVRAWVGGRRWRARPGAIPLRPHAEVVLEIGGYVPPHRAYRFPPGL